MTLDACFFALIAGFVSGVFFGYIAALFRTLWRAIIKFFTYRG